jgi:hypothetical protein
VGAPLAYGAGGVLRAAIQPSGLHAMGACCFPPNWRIGVVPTPLRRCRLACDAARDVAAAAAPLAPPWGSLLAQLRSRALWACARASQTPSLTAPPPPPLPGAYLSEPITEKEVHSGEDARMRYGVASMQGWRTSMEDAHAVRAQPAPRPVSVCGNPVP